MALGRTLCLNGKLEVEGLVAFVSARWLINLDFKWQRSGLAPKTISRKDAEIVLFGLFGTYSQRITPSLSKSWKLTDVSSHLAWWEGKSEAILGETSKTIVSDINWLHVRHVVGQEWQIWPLYITCEVDDINKCVPGAFILFYACTGRKSCLRLFGKRFRQTLGFASHGRQVLLETVHERGDGSEDTFNDPTKVAWRAIQTELNEKAKKTLTTAAVCRCV